MCVEAQGAEAQAAKAKDADALRCELSKVREVSSDKNVGNHMRIIVRNIKIIMAILGSFI